MGKRRITLSSKAHDFYDCNDVPVAVRRDTMVTQAWDVTPPRPFGYTTVMSDGAPISKAEFVALVKRCRDGAVREADE